jgi:hypothetical protein
MANEVDEMRQMIAEARRAFWARVNHDMADARGQAHGFADAVGEVSAEQAHDGWKRAVVRSWLLAAARGGSNDG